MVFGGLYEDTIYRLTFEDRSEQKCTAIGAELMTNGINVEIKYIVRTHLDYGNGIIL